MRYYSDGNTSTSSIVNDIQSGNKVTSRNLLSKSFGYMFIGLLITALVSGLVGYLLSQYVISSNYSDEAFSTSLYITIGGGIGAVIMSFVINIVFLKGKHSLMVPYIIYTFFFGVLLSTLVMFVPMTILLNALGVSCLVFGVLALIGILTKGKMSFLFTFAIGLILGISLISLILYIVSLTSSADVMGTYMLVDYGFFAAMMLLTIFDVNNIKHISLAGEENNNLALFCAVQIYTDFIYIFLKIVIFLLRATSKK